MENRPEVADHAGGLVEEVSLPEIPPAQNRKGVFLLNESLKKSTCSSGDFNLFEVLLEVSLLVVPAVIALLFLALLYVSNGIESIIDLIW
jgi:hypothetical protein